MKLPKEWCEEHNDWTSENPNFYWRTLRANDRYKITIYYNHLGPSYYVVYDHPKGQKNRSNRYMPVSSLEDTLYIIENHKYPPPTQEELAWVDGTPFFIDGEN